VLVVGVAEGRVAFFALGARHGVASSAVLASQFAAITAIMAVVLFRERLTRPQVIGIAAIARASSSRAHFKSDRVATPSPVASVS